MIPLFALVVGSLIIAAAILIAARVVASAVERSRADQRTIEPLTILGFLAPAISAVQQDPRALLVWEPMAAAARRLHPEAFAALDRAVDGRFPFSLAQIEAAHARWTADWLEWERSHDAEVKRRVAAAERDLAAGVPDARARLESIEREKLARYQERYKEYVQVSKALQALTKSA